MKRLFCALPLFVLIGCAQDPDVVRVGKFLIDSFDGSGQKIPRERAAAIPFATMGIDVGSSPQALLILGATMDNEQDWFAGEELYVATRDGHIIRTAGLPYDLGGIHALMANPSAASASEGSAPPFLTVDFPDLGVFGAPLRCSTKDLGDDTILILGASIPTRHIVEHCEVAALRWKFDNDFWKDRMSGYVWRSRQYIHPKSPSITLEVFRPEQRG